MSLAAEDDVGLKAFIAYFEQHRITAVDLLPEFLAAGRDRSRHSAETAWGQTR